MTRHEVWSGYAPWADTVCECRRELVRAARSFWLIPEIFPPLVRDDVALLYCLCRRIDDSVDEAGTTEARGALSKWRDELEGRAPPRPLVAAFLAGVSRTGLSLGCLGSLLDGMESDLGVVRMADDGALLRYAHKVSASVGLMLAPLIGWRAVDDIVALGLALQITNVLLGVADDARRGRVYLPATRLAVAGLSTEDVLAGDRRLVPVLRGLADLADDCYGSACIASAPLRYRHGILLFSRIYRQLGRQAARGVTIPRSFAEIPFLVKARQLSELWRG